MEASHKLQLLADALALEFSQSLASAQCAAALTRVLPGLEYMSIAVSNPAQAGSIVASANCAAEGPTTLHLHDALSSVAGLAMERGQPLQTSLPSSREAKAVPGFTDVQQMVAAAPAATHLLCIPFGCGNDGDGDAAVDDGGSQADEASRCQQHAPPCSGRGALLFGLSSKPSLDGRRAAALAMLAQCLPAPMARLSADTLAFVNLACGNSVQCSCCCAHDSDGEEEDGSGEGHGGVRGGHGGGDDRGGPAQALRVPAAGASPAAGDRAGPSDWRAARGEQPGGKGGGKAAAAAAAAAMGPASPTAHEGRSAGRRFRFSKALMAAAGEGAGIAQQNPLTLAFRSPLMEREYGQWVARYHFKQGDMMTSLLLATALVIVAFIRPYRLVEHAPGSLVLGLGVALPLGLSWLSRNAYMPLRTWLIAAFRIYAVCFINIVCIRAYQVHLVPERMQQWVTFWRITGAESLCVVAVAFRTRLSLHLPLQLAALAIVVWNVPQMCAECFAASPIVSCFKSSAAMAAVFGYLLPTLGLSYLEQRSRSTFANMLQAAVGQEA